jgi:virginiamycin B lyase
MVRMTTRGTTRQFQLPFTNNSSSSLAVGTDGNIWFTDYDQIGSITPAGSVNMFTIPTLDGQISGLAAGPAGTLWFTEFFSCKIGEFKING